MNPEERLGKTFPYTTPSGHTYHAPTDYRSLSARVMDYLQSEIECWEEDESPPNPLAFRDYAKLAWNEAVRANDEIEQLRAEVTNYRAALTSIAMDSYRCTDTHRDCRDNSDAPSRVPRPNRA